MARVNKKSHSFTFLSDTTINERSTRISADAEGPRDAQQIQETHLKGLQ